VPPKIALEPSAPITTQAPRLSASVNPRATASGFFSARVRSIALPARNRSLLAIEVLIQALSLGFWRRRPDLNRGWRFCRPLRNVNLAALSCVLVLSRSRFCLVFGRYCSRIALDSPRHQAARSSVVRCASKRAQKACSHLLGTRLRRAAIPSARTPFWSS
jgi:hypothetical protein